MKNTLLDFLVFSIPLMIFAGANFVRIFICGGGYII